MTIAISFAANYPHHSINPKMIIRNIPKYIIFAIEKIIVK